MFFCLCRGSRSPDEHHHDRKKKKKKESDRKKWCVCLTSWCTSEITVTSNHIRIFLSCLKSDFVNANRRQPFGFFFLFCFIPSCSKLSFIVWCLCWTGSNHLSGSERRVSKLAHFNHKIEVSYFMFHVVEFLNSISGKKFLNRCKSSFSIKLSMIKQLMILLCTLTNVPFNLYDSS